MDEISLLYIALPLIAFLALFVKGIAGIGTSTVLIACATLLIDPKSAIVLSSIINIFGGLFMLRVDPIPLSVKFWAWVAAFMAAGSVIGAFALKMIDPRLFEVLLGIWFLISAVRFLFPKKETAGKVKSPPKTARLPDLSVATLAGFCGGFIGINAPVLISYFGRILDKSHMRRLFVLIFIPAAFAQAGTFYYNGMMDRQIMIYGLISIPMIIAGIYVGNKAHASISERWFKRLLGGFLCVVSLKLIF